jgi:UDP-2-acetamido-3-amino-2,3-dideoxy-glucuronate N-acetyltransferase
LIKRGATIGANATIVCGSIVGRYAFVAAGSVVARGDIPDYALVLGVPGRHHGWVGRHGEKLGLPDASGIMRCPASGWRYELKGDDVLRCLDWREDEPLASLP